MSNMGPIEPDLWGEISQIIFNQWRSETDGDPQYARLKELVTQRLAEAYGQGHASRDPEVAAKDLKIRAMEAEAATCTRHDWHKALLAEREASRKLVEAARKVKAWSDTMTAPAFTWAVEDLIGALKFYAAPGHSPEGK